MQWAKHLDDIDHGFLRRRDGVTARHETEDVVTTRGQRLDAIKQEMYTSQGNMTIKL